MVFKKTGPKNIFNMAEIDQTENNWELLCIGSVHGAKVISGIWEICLYWLIIE